MKKVLLIYFFLGGCLTGMKAQNTSTALVNQTLPFQNTQLSAAQRADDLLARLTLEEKVSLMMDSSPAIPRLSIPQFQWWNEALHGV
jgi:beta-glucosidase